MNLNENTILVTGMTGTLGLRVARRFLEEVREVRGLYRSQEQANKHSPVSYTHLRAHET